MNKIKENLETFFIIWGVILVLNQAVIFGGCFAPYCILAALPHTGIISFLFSIFIIKDDIKKNNEQVKRSDKTEKEFNDREMSAKQWNELLESLGVEKQEIISFTEKIVEDRPQASKENHCVQKSVDSQKAQQQSELNQLYIKYLDLVKQYHQLSTQKIKIVQTINNYEKGKFDIIGEITLKILTLKQNDSYKSMEEYKNYLALYEAHKRKDYHVNSSGEKFDTAFVNNIPAINNKIKDIQFKITMLQKELKILEDKDVYKLAKTLDSKSYFEKEKQKLQLELNALEAQKKPAKKFTIQELPFIQDKPFKIKITEVDDAMMSFSVDGTNYSIAKPKNITWKDTAVRENDICMVAKVQNGNGMKLNLIDVNGISITPSGSIIQQNSNMLLPWEDIEQNQPSKNKKAAVYEDKELRELKLKLKSLESKLQELIEQKTEYLNDLDEFNRKYNLYLGDIIKTILNLRKEILYKKTIKQQKLKTKYQEDLKTFEETKATIDELKNTIDELKSALDQIDEHHEDYDELLSAYDELNEELSKLEQDLDEKEPELEKMKASLDDDEVFQQYEEAKSSFNEFNESYENIKDTQKDKFELDDEQKAELKKLYRKAARLCHPDIVPDELKDQSTQIMQQLNAAYDKQDLAGVQKILESLENGSGFEVSSDRINNQEQLKEKIKEYKANIANIESEIEEILQDETYQTITTLDDWDAYFEELKNDLETEKQKLEEEAKSVLEGKEESIKEVDHQPKPKSTTSKPIQKKIQVESSPYATHIKSIEVPNFEKIRRYCNNLDDENKADAMQKYLAENGRMHKALMYDALEQFIDELNGKEISLIDWGCDQGVASMLVLDYIREKQLDVKIEKIFLLDDNIDVLERALTNVNTLKFQNTSLLASKILPCPECLEAEESNGIDYTVLSALDSSHNDTLLHLFANDNIPFDFQAYDWYDFSFDVLHGYFLCISNDDLFDLEYIPEQIGCTQMLSQRDYKIGRFTRHERIFKFDGIKKPMLDLNDYDEIPF